MKKEIKVLSLLAFIAVLGIFAGVKGVQIFRNPIDTKQVLPASDTRKVDTANNQSNQTQSQSAPKATDYPYSLQISKIGVDVQVESVGQTSSGAMDTPRDSDNAAWYNLGTRVGEKGSSVIAGHYDNADGSPSVFWDLKKLSKGDKLEVVDTNGTKFTYQITRIVTYEDASFPIAEVFGPSDKAKLNLITCGGTWDKKAKKYDKRTVVYSELVE